MNFGLRNTAQNVYILAAIKLIGYLRRPEKYSLDRRSFQLSLSSVREAHCSLRRNEGFPRLIRRQLSSVYENRGRTFSSLKKENALKNLRLLQIYYENEEVTATGSKN